MPKAALTPVLKNVPITSKIRGYRYFSCQGGGMKGGGFVGAAELLEETGVLSQIEAVSGSSAGGIFATLLALGYTAKELRQEMNVLDFRRLQDKDAPGWVESTGIEDFIKGFEPQTKKQKQSLFTIEEIIEFLLSKNLGIWKGDALIILMQRLIARKTGKPNLTFKELDELTRMHPGVFRNLVLTGTNVTSKKLEYYSASEWPDMPISDAIRISASFPFGFVPVTKPILKRLKGADGKPEYSLGVRIDGGFLENLPDIFNHPPYHHLTEGSVTNPCVLALSFKEKTRASKPKPWWESIKSLKFLKDMGLTLLSEKELREKYGDNIVLIDTLEVETLDFDADRASREALSDSGWNALKSTFEKILKKENQVALQRVPREERWKHISLEELVRLRAFLLRAKLPENSELLRQSIQWALPETPEEVEVAQLNSKKLVVLSHINQWIKKRSEFERIDPEELEKRKAEAVKNMGRLLNALTKGRVPLSEEEMVAACQRKIAELANIKKENIKQIEALRLGVAGLELLDVQFQIEFMQGRNKERVDALEAQLFHVKRLKESLKEIHVKVAECQVKREEHRLELEENQKRWDNDEISREVYERRKEELTQLERSVLRREQGLLNEAIEKKLEMKTYITGVIKFYKESGSQFLQDYFRRLEEEFDSPQPSPEKVEDVLKFIQEQTAQAKNHLENAKKKLEETANELKIFRDKLEHIESRVFEKVPEVGEQTGFITRRYEALKQLKIELDRSIYEKTSFIAKINSYFVSDRPSFKNNVITAVLQFVAFTAFMTRVGVFAIVAGIFAPFSIMAAARLVKNYNSEGPAKAAADRFLRFFSMPNLFKINKLRYLSRVTAEVTAALDKNYARADSTEHAYIHKLFQIYLKSSGLKFEDIFPLKEEDTRKSYHEMLAQFRRELEIEAPQFLKDKGGSVDEAALKKLPIYRNFEAFHERVKVRLQKTGIPLTLQMGSEATLQPGAGGKAVTVHPGGKGPSLHPKGGGATLQPEEGVAPLTPGKSKASPEPKAKRVVPMPPKPKPK